MALPATLEAELLRRRCRAHYSNYVQYANPRFYMTHFHRFLCDEIQTFIDTPSTKAMDILLLAVPPQHGKSYSVTETLPSWFLGRDPTAGVIIASYESSLAEAFSRRNRDKFVTAAQDIWLQRDPTDETKFIHDCRANDNVQGVSLWETMQGGRCRAAGLKAGITSHGAELFIIDDPIKSKEQADSDVVLAKIHDEMGPSVQSRIHPGGKLIVIQTRWVEGDVIGWIEENWADYIYKTINLPMEYDEEAAALGPCPLGRKIGDSLIGAHLGDDERLIPQSIRLTNSLLQSKKQLVIRSDGSRTWNALYQGRPSGQQGTLYLETSWKPFMRTALLYSQAEYISLSVDATFKDKETSDFVAMELWVLIGRCSYLWKLVNKRMNFVATLAKIRAICSEFKDIDELTIEDKANGSAIVSVLELEEHLPAIIAVNPQGGKLARAQATSNYVNSGSVYVPTDFTEAEAADVDYNGKDNLTTRGRFVKQHTSFPFGKNDDMVDAQTQQLNRMLKFISGDIAIPKRSYVRYTHWHADMWEDYESLDDNGKEWFVKKYGAPEEWQDVS